MSVRVAAATALRFYFKPWICLQSVWAAWKWSICETDLCNRLQRRIPNLTVRGLSESCCTHLRIKASSSRRELSTPFCIPPLCYSFQPMLRSWLHLKIHLESSGPVNGCSPATCQQPTHHKWKLLQMTELKRGKVILCCLQPSQTTLSVSKQSCGRSIWRFMVSKIFGTWIYLLKLLTQQQGLQNCKVLFIKDHLTALGKSHSCLLCPHESTLAVTGMW